MGLILERQPRCSDNLDLDKVRIGLKSTNVSSYWELHSLQSGIIIKEE